MRRDPAFPGIGAALGLVVLHAILSGIAGAAMALAGREGTMAMAAATLWASALVLLVGVRMTGAAWSDVFPFTRISARHALPMVLTVLGLGILVSETDNLLRRVLPPPEWFDELFDEMLEDPLAGFFVLVIVAPITEELLFRGLILRGFLSRYSSRKALVLSAVLFGVFHLNPWQLFPATVAGLVLGWWFIQTRSLVPCVLGHAVHNSVFWLLVNAGVEVAGYTSPGAGELQPLWLDLLGLALAAIGVWMLTRMFARNRVTQEPVALTPQAPPPGGD